MIKPLSLKKPPRRILVISMRYLGDLVLTTALIRSLRLAYPDARLDVLTYTHTAPLLEGNPDVDRVILTSHRPKAAEYWSLFKALFRRYDLALVPQPGNRRNFYAILAAPARVLMIPPRPHKGWWKRVFAQGWVESDGGDHIVHELVNMLRVLGVPARQQLVPPKPAGPGETLPAPWRDKPFAVLHICPQWRFKQWTVEGWVETARHLLDAGLWLIFSGGPGEAERAYIESVRSQLTEGDKTLNLAGQPSLPALADLLSRAKLFIGVDTGITHLAAAAGIPVVALFGPTSPKRWGPWPANYDGEENPYRSRGCQRIGNIILIQGEGDCVPCWKMGCDNDRQSRSECLDRISPKTVIAAAEEALTRIGFLPAA